VQVTIFRLLSLCLGILVVRPFLHASRGGGASLRTVAGGMLSPMSLAGPDGSKVDMNDPAAVAASMGASGNIGGGTAPVLGLPAPDPQSELTEIVGENLDDAAALLASWLDLDKSKTEADSAAPGVAA